MRSCCNRNNPMTHPAPQSPRHAPQERARWPGPPPSVSCPLWRYTSSLQCPRMQHMHRTVALRHATPRPMNRPIAGGDGASEAMHESRTARSGQSASGNTQCPSTHRSRSGRHRSSQRAWDGPWRVQSITPLTQAAEPQRSRHGSRAIASPTCVSWSERKRSVRWTTAAAAARSHHWRLNGS